MLRGEVRFLFAANDLRHISRIIDVREHVLGMRGSDSL